MASVPPPGRRPVYDHASLRRKKKSSRMQPFCYPTVGVNDIFGGDVRPGSPTLIGRAQTIGPSYSARHRWGLGRDFPRLVRDRRVFLKARVL